MKLKNFIFFIFIATSVPALAQKDTLLYYIKANGDSTSSRKDAYCKLVIFPADSISKNKLSRFKGLSFDGKMLFSGFSTKHGFPVNIEGPYTEYYPNGVKKSLE